LYVNDTYDTSSSFKNNIYFVKLEVFLMEFSNPSSETILIV